VEVAALPKVATTISFAPVVVMLGVLCDVPATVDWPSSTSIGFTGSTPEYARMLTIAFCELPSVKVKLPSFATASFQ